jgi:dienelactone hydrolase
MTHFQGLARPIARVAATLTVAIAALACGACEPSPPAHAVTGVGSGWSWSRVDASSRGASIYYGQLAAAAKNTGPYALIVPGGGGQVSVDVAAQARAYAAEGLRPVVACIATISGMFKPSPATSCAGTPAATPAKVAAGREVLQVINALRSRYPSLKAAPDQLVIVGDSYGGAAALHAAELSGLPHPVVTVNGTNTWLGKAKPVVPAGDLDPALPQMLAGLKAPVVQVVGAVDSMVPPGVAASFASRAKSAGHSVPTVSIRGADHIAPINADAGSCPVRQVVAAVRAVAAGDSVASRTAC